MSSLVFIILFILWLKKICSERAFLKIVIYISGSISLLGMDFSKKQLNRGGYSLKTFIKEERLINQLMVSKCRVLSTDNLINIANLIALPITILGLWEMVTELQLFSPAILPSPKQVIITFEELILSGELQSDLAISLSRVLKGYGAAVILGVGFGIFMGIYTRVNRFFMLVFDAVRQIPPLAWIPLIILWFGIGETSKVVIIFKAAFFPVLVNTISGIQNVSGNYLEVARICRTNKIDLLRKVYFPASLASIFVGLRLGLGAAWMTMVAAELIAASSGIGYRINDGRELSQPDMVVVGMIVIGVVGVIMDMALKILAKRLLSWRG
ncbi:MAG TPA: ABC transporter permease [Methylomusa anaerophila]|uniref:ABC transporter permease n=1 Tax=Methylomusa anaerophila TaxID=1930071 RepID=UPI0018D57DC9|nr:ABC transporter permease [Methylomusa anaerophila]HML88247.1 ABC transporter permease [Methylomusa anaerophila]